MGKTKDRILGQALALFNDRGLAAVTMRDMAQAAGISLGNLTYHFAKREDIVAALYFQLVARIDAQLDSLQQAEPDLASILDLSRLSMRLFVDYRFLMLDFVQVMRTHPELKAHYRHLRALRSEQFGAIFAWLQGLGLMRAEAWPGEYANLLLRTLIIGDFWMLNVEILSDEGVEANFETYFRAYSDSLYPYLTEKGRAEFEAWRAGLG